MFVVEVVGSQRRFHFDTRLNAFGIFKSGGSSNGDAKISSSPSDR
jgi:hypothetical protein